MIQSTKTEFNSEDECLFEISRLRLLLQQRELQPEVIPQELARSNQWVIWKYEVSKQESGMFRVNKQAYQPNNPKWEVSRYCVSNWSDLTTALGCLRENSYFDGIGYIFAEGDGLIGIDFDNCRDRFTGVIRPEFKFWIEKFSSYTEISPSGTGVKVWIKGTIADKYFKYTESRGFRILNFADGEIEIYRRGQYFTVTTQMINGYDSIRDAQAELDVICEFSLSNTDWNFRYFPCSNEYSEQDANIELSILKTYWDDISLAYTDESDIQPNGLKEAETNFHLSDVKLPPANKDRFGKSECNKCGRDSGIYELCSVCYEAGYPEEKVEDAVYEYFSKFPSFSVVRQPDYELTIGSYKSKPDLVMLDAEENIIAIAECKREGIIYNGKKQLKSYLMASDTQFGVFANSIDLDDWIFYENLRRHNFKKISRTRFEESVTNSHHIETIREEKARLDRETSALDIRKKTNELKNQILKSTNDNLTAEINTLSKQKDLLENKIGTMQQEHTRKVVLKQLRNVVNRLKTAEPEQKAQIEGLRKQLVKRLKEL